MQPPSRSRAKPAAVAANEKAAAAAVAGTDLRARSSGLAELQGAQPYRPDFVKGVVAEVSPARGSPPRRNADGDLMFDDAKDFRPQLSPEQVMRLGAFGGTYWRPIASGVTGERLSGAHKEFPESWFAGLPASKLTRSWSNYDTAVNRYRVKCGGSLDMWESSGWISNIDPYGWFQWYCRFYSGRRSSDDQRQIQRWLSCAGPAGRFRNQLIGKCARGGTSYDDWGISPVIRQSLMHWGYQLTAKQAEAYVKKKQLPKLKPGAEAVDFTTFALDKSLSVVAGGKRPGGGGSTARPSAVAVGTLRDELSKLLDEPAPDQARVSDLLTLLGSAPVSEVADAKHVGKVVKRAAKGHQGLSPGIKATAKSLIATWKTALA